MVHVSMWILIILILIFMTCYIYVNEKEKYESLNLSEEGQILKEFQEKEKSRIQRLNSAR